MATLTVGVLGLGIFGHSIISTLKKYDCDIIAIDLHDDNINYHEPYLARGIIGDITDKELLKEAGIETCDTVVVSTGENLEASVLAVMHCKALGVPKVIAKVSGKTTMEVLYKVGADWVISPERETGISLAKQIIHQSTRELIQLDENVVMVEFEAPENWVGKSLLELNLPKKHHLNIIGFRTSDDAPLTVDFTPDYIIQEGDLIMAVMDNQTVDKLDKICKKG